MPKKSAFEAAATAPDFYNPQFALVDIKRDFDAVANIKTEDKAEKLLNLADINNQLNAVSNRVTESLKERSKKSTLANKVFNGTVYTSTLMAIGAGVYLGAGSGATDMVTGGLLLGLGGALGGAIVGAFAGVTSEVTFARFSGLSKKDKTAIKSGIKLTQELKLQVDAEFEKTLQNLSREDIAASPLRERLFEKFPRIAYDFKTAQLAHTKKPVATIQPAAPAPEPEKTPRLKITLKTADKTG